MIAFAKLRICAAYVGARRYSVCMRRTRIFDQKSEIMNYIIAAPIYGYATRDYKSKMTVVSERSHDSTSHSQTWRFVSAHQRHRDISGCTCVLIRATLCLPINLQKQWGKHHVWCIFQLHKKMANVVNPIN